MKDKLVQYWGNIYDRAAIMTLGSFALNAAFGVMKLVLGVYYFSAWFIINAIYYLLLCYARGHAVRKYALCKQIPDEGKRYDQEFALYRSSGIFICLLGLSYLLLCLRMYHAGDATIYSGYMVYFIALVAFCKTGFAIRGMIVNRHMKNRIVTALKVFNITDALVSIVVTQCTLLAMEYELAEAAHYSAIVGMAFSTLIAFMGARMLMKQQKQLMPEKMPFMAATINEK